MATTVTLPVEVVKELLAASTGEQSCRICVRWSHLPKQKRHTPDCAVGIAQSALDAAENAQNADVSAKISGAPEC